MMAGGLNLSRRHNDVLAEHRSPGNHELSGMPARNLIDHDNRRLDIRRPTVAAVASHSFEKLCDPRNMLPPCGGELRRVQYLRRYGGLRS